jgi:hypothetical protein
VSFRGFRLPTCSTPDFVAEGGSQVERKLTGNRDTSRAQSFGNSFEKTLTRRSPAIVEKDGQAETHKATAREGKAGKTPPEASKNAGCFTQEFRFEKECVTRAAFCKGIEWR